MTTHDDMSRHAEVAREIEEMEVHGIDRPGLHADGGELPHNETFGDVLARNLERRTFLAGAAATVPVLMATSFGSMVLPSEAEAGPSDVDGLGFQPIRVSTVDEVLVPTGYRRQVLISWGDPLTPTAPFFDGDNQTAAAQRQQFGYNCDFVGYFPQPVANRALLCVNHEYTTGGDMFDVYQPGVSKAQADIEIAAHGGSVVEIVLQGSVWRYVRNSTFNRRITGDTPMTITGPAAGHPLMQTTEDPTGTRVLGMLNNCAGGKTPWGTWLTCEENFNQYFANNDQVADADIKAAHSRYGVSAGATQRGWEAFYDRYDLTKEPNEPFRFGWVVEIDPYDPTFVPRKRTALGRTKHEAATTILSANGRVVVYSGDDQQFDYIYKFVSRSRYNPDNRSANFNLLDEGTLYVAKFYDDGRGRWIALKRTDPRLASAFATEGELLIKTRQAADIVGATAMDRPEDCEPNPVNGKVYLTMTNNTRRTTVVAPTAGARANPRVPNANGHIIELTEQNNDHAAIDFTWNIFLLCGDATVDLKTTEAELTPGLPATSTFFAGYANASRLAKIAAPDNITFDARGNLWITTDGQPGNSNIGRPNDAIHVVPTAGPDRGYLRQFLSGPKGAEVSGPEFTPDNRTLFAAIQHPGEDGGYPNTVSTWPDNNTLPRPSVVAVRKNDGGVVGS